MKTDQEIYDEYATDTRKARRKTGLSTQEFFTPPVLVKHMCDKISEEDWSDLDKTFLEPSLGNGNFVVEILRRRLTYCKTEDDVYKVLGNIYGTELMQDNVEEAKQRILMILLRYSSDHDMDLKDKKIMEILDNNLVCTDFFTWNFEEWRPMTEEEIKLANKKK